MAPVDAALRKQIVARLAIELSALGYRRSKPTFFIRERPFLIEFIHLHKFSFGPKFRVHAGIRILQDTFDAPGLNGPDSSSDRFSYSTDVSSVTVCAHELSRWCATTAEAWFVKWRDPEHLITRSDSPLPADAKLALRDAIAGRSNPDVEARSRKLLGAG
jgi:hypothetical protein